MVISYDPTWTAVTAEMEFLGETVGELQDFTVDEQFGVQRMMAIGSPVDLKHVPGVYQATVTARRAFLDMNAVFSAMTTIDARNFKDGTFTASSGTSAIATDLPKIKAALESTTLDRNSIIASLDFDIVIYEKYVGAGVPANPVTGTAATGATPTKKQRYSLNFCTVNSRSMSISAGNIIVMENVNILARSRTIAPGTLV